MQKFTILDREIVLDTLYCTVEKQLVQFPNGETGDWYVKSNQTNKAVIVVPMLTNGEVLLQKTYKHGFGDFIVEFMAGMIDEGETPEDAAIRELREETGHVAQSMTPLGNVCADPTSSGMQYFFFRAEGCEPQGQQELDHAEQIEVFSVENLEAARALLTSGEVKTSAATLAALTMAS